MKGVDLCRAFLLAASATVAAAQVEIGELRTRQHQVAGRVWALSSRVVEVRGFVFDGNAPAAFFWADTNSRPSTEGYILQDASPSSSCGSAQLPGANGTQTYIVEFPEGTSIWDILGGSISVWCEAFAANFGEVVVPADLQGLPDTDEATLECSSQESTGGGGGEISIGSFTTRQHQVDGEVVVLSERVLEVRGFTFDGNAPAAFFWADTNSQPSSQGFILQDASPSSNCGSAQLPGANGTQTYIVEFPDGTSILDILGGSISVWCEAFAANFGEVVVPADLQGLAETDEATLECSAPQQETPPPQNLPITETPEGYNCEPLNDDFQVRWKVDGDQIAVELVGLIGESEYMGFGISGNDTFTNMVGADAVVADVFNDAFRARDFYMNTRAQCSNGDGVCPDDNSGIFGNDVTDVSGEEDSGVTLIRYKRPLAPADMNGNVGGRLVDRAISVEPGVSTFIVWALGPVDSNTGLPFFHSIDFPRNDVSLEFGRTEANNCPLLASEEEQPSEVDPFQIYPLSGVTEFTARIGPSGGDRGYMGITGRAGWGIAWYINDFLIPVIEMRRGTTYTFRINGGDDSESPSEFHPMYLTTSIDGGYSQRTPQERAEETVFAGIEITEQTDDAVTGFNILAAGPACVYSTTDETGEAIDGTFEEFFESLDTSCADDAALSAAAWPLEFTPDENTPDLLYYQCVTHRNLGWEIKVIDADAPSIFEVDCSNLGDAPIALTNDVSLNAVIDPVANTLIAELTYNGIGWLAMGFTAGAAQMVGSEAVIGLPGQPISQTNPGKYNLNAQSAAGVQLMPDTQQTLVNSSVVQENGQTILKFTKLLVEPDEHPISETEENTFLFAYGFDNNLGVHEQRGGFTVAPRQCRVLVDGVVENSEQVDPQTENPETEGPETATPTTDSPQEVGVPPIAETPEGFNCEPLSDEFQVRWQVQGDQLAIELVGLIDDLVYMGFGVSGSDTSTNMVGADAVIADFFEGEARARDFYMNTRAPCANGNGVCPDDTNPSFADDTSNISGQQGSGITLVSYTRPLVASNSGEDVGGQPVDHDISVEPGASTFIVWALGPLNEDTGLPLFHNIDFPSGDVSMEFGRDVEDNCNPLVGGITDPPQPTEPPEEEPFLIFPITDTTEFSARIGPPGGDRGYAGITGRDPFGVSWYINDVLIPVIEMRRGTTYTFRVNGGDDEQTPGDFHPLYLTESIDGGYFQSTPQERAEETVFAGINIIDQDGGGVQDFTALAAGPLCLYATTDGTNEALSGSFDDFFASLDTSCADDASITGAAATLEFTPDQDTPDLIYYQCVTHRNLGWEIKVIDVDAPSILEVDCSNLNDSPIDLTAGLTLSAVIDPVANTLTAELVYDGIAWVAMGFTAGGVVMVGSEAVIGLPGQPNSQSNPGKYDLNAQSVQGVTLMGDERQTLSNSSIVQENGQTILRFTKLLVEPDEHPISETEVNTFLWAYGFGNDLGIHAARGGINLAPAQCRVLVEGILQNPNQVGAPEFENQAPNLNRNLWVAHGVCAATAWAILVPLAVGSSLVRNILEAVGMPKGAWFQIHRVLNMIAFFLTVAAFSLAVKAINDRPNPTHFSDITHHTLGLVIFILTFFQALGGILRPHLPSPVALKDGEEEADGSSKRATPQKSVLRRTWEIFHRLVGAALLGMAWWQVQDGFGLFARNFGEDDIKGAFGGILGGICGCFLILFVYQKFVLKT